MNIEWLPISDLTPNPKNPNKHSKDQITRIQKLIEYYGWRHPIIVSKESGLIVVGHGRLEAAMKMGLDKVPVSIQSFESPEQEYGFLVADNAIASWAELDLKNINLEVPDLGPDFDIDLLGIEDFEIDAADKYQEGEDDVPDVGPAVSKLGDLFTLGNHRLLCGDATDSAAVERLMNGEKADMVYTDPPYGFDYDPDWTSVSRKTESAKVFLEGISGRNYKREKIKNDSTSFDASFIFNIFDYCDEIFLFGADYYAESIPNRINGSWIVWDKRQQSDGSNLDKILGSCFELCWSKKRHKRDIARIKWAGLFGTESQDIKKRIHPNQKPIQLTEWFFERWAKDKTNIVDLYGGSGSTLIACEKTNRRCFLMEIDPHYCDVIIARWEKFTGQKAVKLESNNQNQELSTNGKQKPAESMEEGRPISKPGRKIKDANRRKRA